MSVIRLLLSLFFVIISAGVSFSQTVNTDSLIADIVEVGEVHHERIGRAGSLSEQYQRYKKLSGSLSLEDLLQLTKHKNAAVRVYASWALIDHKKPDITGVFKDFLNDTSQVLSFSNCIKSRAPVSSEMYHRYWNGLKRSKAKDQTLITMDSLIIFASDSDWLLKYRAFNNRVYPASYLPRIEALAFREIDIQAINYLYELDLKRYSKRLESALMAHLQKTEFRTRGLTPYYEVVEQLLKFQNADLLPTIKEKLVKDKFWEHRRKQFQNLFAKYGYPNLFD